MRLTNPALSRLPHRRLWLVKALILGAGLVVLASRAHAESGHFPAPAELRGDIDFWKRIYSEIDSQAGLLHDEQDLRIVYETIQFPPDLNPRQRQQQVDQRKSHYQKLLQQLASDKATPSPEALALAGLWPHPPKPAELKAAGRRIRFQLGQADQFRTGLIRAGAYSHHVRRTLLSHDVPAELGLLPLVESSYNHLARSRLGAAGMWQFTRTTGRRYMRIDRIVDERIDPFRSTEAAAQLLKQNYKLTGNWPLAITAYNHGVAGVRRAVRELESDRIEDLVRQYRSRRFGFASRNFYVAFVAAIEVAAAAEALFGPLQLKPGLDTRLLRVPHYVKAGSLAEALGLDLEQLRELNPALRKVVWDGRKRVPRDFELRVPAELGGGEPEQLLARVPAEEWYASQHIDRMHKVRRGQTLSGIAAEYGISQRELASYNAIGDRDFLRVGQVLHLPQSGEAAPQPLPASGRYQVRQGDNLTLIAQRFGMEPAELMELNSLDDANRIFPGDHLTVGESVEKLQANAAPITAIEDVTGNQPPEPDVSPDVVSLDDPTDYSVAADGTIEIQVLETLGHYAAWAQTNIADLRRLNGLGGKRVLVVGRRLQLNLKPNEIELFERRRTAFHRRVQTAFFSRYEVTGTQEHRVRDGDSLWILAQRHYGLPVWLLRQYNPDIDPDRVRAGVRLIIPQIARRQQDNSDRQIGRSG